ncbi:MAG: hypothetical protein WB789_06280 [Thermoplasmata archaeon]
MSASAPDQEFDLTEVSARLAPLASRKRWIFIGVIAFLLAFGSLIFGAKAEGLPYRSFDAYAIADLGLILAIVVVGLGIAVPAAIRAGPPAIRLSIDDSGFDLTYPNGSIARTKWLDPRLRFDLVDMTQVNPAKLLSGNPYSVMVRGSQSALTPEAYMSLLAEVSSHGLVDDATLGSRWVFDADADPLIHRIRAGVGEVRITGHTPTPPNSG